MRSCSKMKGYPCQWGGVYWPTGLRGSICSFRALKNTTLTIVSSDPGLDSSSYRDGPLCGVLVPASLSSLRLVLMEQDRILTRWLQLASISRKLLLDDMLNLSESVYICGYL